MSTETKPDGGWMHRFVHWIGWAPSEFVGVSHGVMTLRCRTCGRITHFERQ